MITGNRIILRAWERSDLEAFTRWFNDPEITIYLGNSHPCMSFDQEQRFYENSIDEKHRYCITLKEDGRLIGNCSLIHMNTKDRSAEVGIVIGEKNSWSQGYGREALGLLLEIGFEGLGLNRIFLRHMDFNERGHRCYLAAGFVDEGRFRQDTFVRGEFHDTVLMSVLAEEYFARKRAKEAA